MANGTSTPSSIALENERRVTALESNYKDLDGKMESMVVWMRKLETAQEANAAATNLKIEASSAAINSKLDRLTNKPASTYIGIISLIFGAIGSAAALIVFVQDARLEPLRSDIKMMRSDDDRSFDQWVSDFERLVRLESINNVDSKEKRTYPRTHGRPAR